ncbi:MAG: glutamate synthase large subunit [SAR324 cluster bacterium]|nr:glutamate synthase large subunit [SAR324 cluster bacterium]MBL7034151.1 glutamate synthase large subunit [SAR324 cluster bacterium]
MKYQYPEKQGLYDPQFEHDNCGVGFVVQINNKESHQIVEQGLRLLCNLDHRGALGADPKTGDGSGILIQIPHQFFLEECQRSGFYLPEAGEYGIASIFLPQDPYARRHCGEVIESHIVEKGMDLLGWRDVPIDRNFVGKQALAAMPAIRQLFMGHRRLDNYDQDRFENKLYVTRKAIRSSLQDVEGFMITSMSSRTVIYKGMLIPHQMEHFFPDLSDHRLSSALALVHTRFPTNTFPRWDLAQPFRNLAHNGEINTLRGNINWMLGRRATLKSEQYENISELQPIIIPRGSDSACMDNVFEFLIQSGYSLPHAMMMMVPEAWEHNSEMTAEKKAFYEFHEHLMEAWDGPASLTFTDGVQIGATLDRNGLRPSRYIVTKDDLVIMGSEVGAVQVEAENIKLKGRLQPGKMFLVDTKEGRIIDDAELKANICSSQPYEQWLKENVLELSHLPAPAIVPGTDFETLLLRQKIFGYTTEDVRLLLTPMVVDGVEASGSMGNDTPLAVLSEKPRLLYDYFKQIFAQVSNPPVDAIREELVMSLTSRLGAEKNILEPGASHARMLKLHHPILSNEEFAQIKDLNKKDFSATTLSMLFDKESGVEGFSKALKKLCNAAESAVNSGSVLVVLSDRGIDKQNVAIPALLAVSAVHHYLNLKRVRYKTGIIVETGEAREIAHFCLLVSYGAGAVNPYLAFETIEQMHQQQELPSEITLKAANENYYKSIRKGMFKVFSKMGISTIQSYRGAQIFEAIGLNDELVQDHFTGTPSRIGGIGLREIALETLLRHDSALIESPEIKDILPGGGSYNWRRGGEYHQINPLMTNILQRAVRKNSQSAYDEFARLVNGQTQRFSTPRSLLEFTEGTPVPLNEVEPAAEIVKRFVTGAMSLGSISSESHETLAIAMNRIGGRSNSGEGGEDSARFEKRENGDLPVSAIKQVASGRFGVTINYLVNCTEIQIKVAQGAKPGEGGQLPGKKVSQEIAKIRNSTPGVTLISPPPHHDIYSIEDLAQLIFDLKNANPEAKINVKLVAEAGVGTIAAGVAKAHADIITIAGHDGGTGASPLTSIKHAGVPWELGLSEAHQTLILNQLRGRVRLQTDGQLKTGRDVAVAALLGAEEFGFATIPLVAIGCIMMRKCHLNTCPVGIATQNPELREKFSGQPEHVINYFFFVAEELRKIMAELGFRKVEDMIGRTEMLRQRTDIEHWKASKVDLSAILHQIPVGEGDSTFCTQQQDHGLEKQLDHQLIAKAKEALENKKAVEFSLPIFNINRSVGTMLSSQIARKYGAKGLPDETIHCKLNGSAGQSFGAFLAHGVTLELEGDANDYTGKGLSGGRLVIYPPKSSSFCAAENILIGNTVLYGATGGEVYFSGIAGERFAVRNSGATAVVEGTGDHGCEYMTGGKVIILGETGKNFAAGMSGGIAYVYDQKNTFDSCCNTEMVELETVCESQEQKFLRSSIERHKEYTGSVRAAQLLENWEKTLTKFIKVMPIEYRTVLAKMKKQPQTTSF